MNKVAICFYGQPRFYKQVLPIWRKIIEELNADVFIHTWYGQERTKEYVDVNELISDFNPKEIELSHPHRFMDIIPKDSKFQNQSFHAMQQAYSITQSVKLLDKYEKDLHNNYDVIIRCRMDIKINNPDSFIEYVKNKEVYDIAVCGKCWAGSKMFDDNLMVGSAAMIKELFKGFFTFTILYIHNTKIIPGGENNLYNYINDNNVYELITREEALNFELLYMKPGEFIMNQNER